MGHINTGDISLGFYVGIGVILAFFVVGLVQMTVMRAAHRG